MHPILFSIGDFAVHGYGALAAIGFLVVVFISIRRARALGVDTNHLVDVIFITSIAAVVGARALWVFQNPDAVSDFASMINVRNGGLVFYGAILAGVPAGIATLKYRKLPVLPLADVFATALPFGHALSRVGCFLAGCCYGTESSLPWAVTFSHPLADAPSSVALHPTQLYEAGAVALVGVALTLLYTKKRFDGQILLIYLGLYALVRIPVESVRGDLTRGFLFEGALGQALSVSQGVSLAILVVVGIAWWQLSRRPAANAG